MSDFTRRTFLKAVTASTAAATVPAALLQGESPNENASAWPENGTLIPDENWRLWVDDKAPWATDDIHLPEDVDWVDGVLHGGGKPLPANAPTGGWAVLRHDAGKEVVLPTTVEQHFWGRYGAGVDGKPRAYTPEEYRYAATGPDAKPPADDTVPQNGAYFGVSWWFREIDIPAAMRGKRIFLHVRGARLRAEVYLNQKLVGYSIMEELPFECDLTNAADAGGLNVLAIRITNPFGRFDWVDGLNAKWGKVSLYRSHGFGGIDRGMTISAHDDVRITSFKVFNTVDPRIVYIPFVEWDRRNNKPNSNMDVNKVSVKLAVIDPLSGEQIASEVVESPGMGTKLSCPLAELWSIDTPRLYHLRVTLTSNYLGIDAGDGDTRTITFGFRWFAPTGLGTNAMFRLNGKRIRLYSAISWGFWGLNGLFPVPDLAEKEVRMAQALGLNCLNFHRNLAKEEVLRWHDKLGVLRYLEPGGGKLALGKPPGGVAEASAHSQVMLTPQNEAEKFAQRFMFTKCVEMVKAHRSHPSVVMYSLQNELGADFNNPATLAILEAMHKEDPSRIVELNDGFVERGAAQAWYEPWDAELKSGKLHRSDQTAVEKFAGWWNDHQGAGDQWYDEFYQSPAKFTYRAPYKGILTEYGEMEGCARPDNHALMIHQITETYKKYGGTSYDLADHEEILTGYDRFLDKWGFRKVFPTAESVFLACGKTCYESWMSYMENARISDELDYAVISGWESTSIENHSGIVDNLRNPKADPKLIAGSLLPVRPIAKQRTTVVEQGKKAVFDLWLANDTSQAATGTLTFSMVTPSGKLQTLTTPPMPRQSADIFSYLLKEGFTTPTLSEEGLYRFRFAISSAPLAAQTKEIWVAAVEPYDSCKAALIAASNLPATTRKQLDELGCAEVSEWKVGNTYAAIVTSGLVSAAGADAQIGETTGTESTPPANIKPHPKEPGEGAVIVQEGRIDPAVLDAVRAGTSLLVLAQSDALADGCAKQLAAAGAFTYNGQVGDFRAPWMGNWYFVREHPLYAGMPVNQAMGLFYQAKGRQSNGLLVDGPGVEVVVGYSRDHDRRVGAGTFTARLGKGRILFHRCPDFHPVLQQRFLANALRWLVD